MAYCADDVLYYPDWLEAHLDILDSYPDVGMVSGAPVGYSSEHALSAVENFIGRNTPDLSLVEKPRVDEWEESWAISTGRSVVEHLTAIQKTPNIHITYNGVESVQSAKHFQFVTPQEVICRAFSPEWSGSLMDGLVSLDESVDNLGYLRLSTPDRYTRHIGNTLSQEIINEAEKLHYSVEGNVQDMQENKHWILRIPGSGRILWPLYRWLFKILHKVR